MKKHRITPSLLAAAAIATGLAAAGPSSAHHSYAMFDLRVESTVSGTVRVFEWTNPHTWIWVNVTAANGDIEQWGFEGMSPNYLQRRGWSGRSLSAGDQVTVTFNPVRNGGNGGSFVRVTMDDGTSYDMMGGAAPAR